MFIISTPHYSQSTCLLRQLIDQYVAGTKSSCLVHTHGSTDTLGEKAADASRKDVQRFALAAGGRSSAQCMMVEWTVYIRSYASVCRAIIIYDTNRAVLYKRNMITYFKLGVASKQSTFNTATQQYYTDSTYISRSAANIQITTKCVHIPRSIQQRSCLPRIQWQQARQTQHYSLAKHCFPPLPPFFRRRLLELDLERSMKIATQLAETSREAK
jgi:hypothetical protein